MSGYKGATGVGLAEVYNIPVREAIPPINFS